MHLNSYYVQMRGALDNLAWAVHYERSLFGAGDESDRKIQRRCYLFGPEFIRALRGSAPTLAVELAAKVPWADEFKALRDPVAHRVPLYAPPIVIETQEEVEQFRRIDAERVTLVNAGDLKGAAEKLDEVRRVGTYRPWFATSGVDQVTPMSIPERIAIDQANFLDACESVLRSLFPDACTSVGL